MADTEDLKSSGPKGRAGSNPALGIARSILPVQEHSWRILILSEDFDVVGPPFAYLPQS